MYPPCAGLTEHLAAEALRKTGCVVVTAPEQLIWTWGFEAWDSGSADEHGKPAICSFPVEMVRNLRSAS